MALPYHSFISWKLGPLTIQSYGMFVAIAFLAGIFLAVKEAKKRKINLEQVYDLSFYILIGGIIGARVAHVIEYWHNFDGLIDIFKIWQGGLSFFGGFLGALLLAFVYIKAKKLDFWKYADLFTPALVLGHAIGRIGCILGDGGHVGKLTTMPWGFLVNGEVRHVTAYYSFVFLILLFVFLYKIKDRKFIKENTGSLFLIYLFTYSIGRVIIDLFRADPTYAGLTITQWFLIVTFITSGYLLINKPKKK